MAQVERQGRQPVVSVVTIVYNNVKYIKDALESVLSQDYPSIEYIVIELGAPNISSESFINTLVASSFVIEYLYSIIRISPDNHCVSSPSQIPDHVSFS